MIISFPEKNPEFEKRQGLQCHRYYDIHYRYMLNLLTAAGCKIKMVDSNKFENYSRTCFEILVDGKLVAIDFSDHIKLSVPVDKIEKYIAIFKFHYVPSLHSGYKNIFPFSPVNFQSWSTYSNIVNKIDYKASGYILCKQKPGGAAVQRRTMVQDMLDKNFGKLFDKNIEDEVNFYMKINEALVSVCVPGARNDMLDRGQGQYMALGCCTISPKLITILSHNMELIPNVHYVECKPDYSDLIDKIKWVNQNKEQAIEIGKKAQSLFNNTSLPQRQIEWINKCINNG